MTVSSVKFRELVSLIPFPKKLFSDIANPIVPPSDPAPAPTEISPVGFSSTVMSIIFVDNSEPSLISAVTDLNKLIALKLLILFALNNSLQGHLHQFLVHF